MNVMIAANLSDKGEDFLTQFKSLCAELGLDVDEHAAMERTYLCVCEPMQAADQPEIPQGDAPQGDIGGMEISIAVPTPEIPDAAQSDFPPVELASPTFDADLAAQAAAAVSTDTTVGAPVEEPTSQITDCGPHIILSLSSTVQVPCTVDLSSKESILTVMTDVPIDHGLLNFWYGGLEFRMPQATDAGSVQNQDHEIKPNTIRIVAQKVGEPDKQFAALVDVVRGDADALVLGFDVQ